MHFLISTDRRGFVIVVEVVLSSSQTVEALLEQAIDTLDVSIEEDSYDSVEDLFDAGGGASILERRRRSMTARLASFSSCSVHSGDKPGTPSDERCLNSAV